MKGSIVTKLAKGPAAITLRSVFLAALAFGLNAPSRSYAATLTVCTSGCDYTTIVAAVAAATPGDTVSIQDAVHYESGIIVDRNLTIQGRGASDTAVDGSVGGTIFTVNDRVTATIQDLTIQNGSAGGISNGGTLTVSNSAISGNYSSEFEGIYSSGVLTITNSTVAGNYGYGTTIFSSGSLTISNSTVADNRVDGGAAAVTSIGTATVVNSTIARNSYYEIYGGTGIGNGGTLIVTNSTISDNGAGLVAGGGISNGGTLTVSNTTISGNYGDFGGGGIFNEGLATVKNSIVANSSGEGDGPWDCAGTITSLGTNLDTDGSCSGFTQVTSAQLNLGALALNSPRSGTETEALLPGSVAIDAVTDCTDVAGKAVTVDQRRVHRPQGRACDIGSFEVVQTPAQIVVKPVSVAFPDTVIGSTSNATVEVRNVGTAQLIGTVNTPKAPFGLTGSGSFSLEPKSSTTITLTFTPTSTKGISKADTVVSNSVLYSNEHIALHGIGKAAH